MRNNKFRIYCLLLLLLELIFIFRNPIVINHCISLCITLRKLKWIYFVSLFKVCAGLVCRHMLVSCLLGMGIWNYFTLRIIWHYFCYQDSRHWKTQLKKTLDKSEWHKRQRQATTTDRLQFSSSFWLTATVKEKSDFRHDWWILFEITFLVSVLHCSGSGFVEPWLCTRQ